MSDYAIQFVCQCQIIEVFRITQVSDYAGSTVLVHNNDYIVVVYYRKCLHWLPFGLV